MVSLAAPCSCPASSQLRLGFGSRRWGQVRLLVRSAGFSGAGVRLRVRALSAAAAARGGESDDGRGFQGSSWGTLGKSELSDAVDSFSGWDGSVSDESKQWGKFGGSMGAALGGILLVGAAVFGALSIKQRSSGLKQQMLSLTADQEELLASDEISETVQTEKEGTTIISDSESTQNRSIPEDGTGIHQTSSAPSEASCESTSKSSPGDITDSMSLLDNVNPEANELMSLSSNQEVTTHGDDFVPTSIHLISPDMPMQSVVNFPETTTDTVGLCSDVNLIENVSSDDTSDLAASGIDSTSLYQKIDGASEFQKTDNLYPSTVKSNSAAVQLKESASLNAPVTPKSDAILDLKVEHKASMGAVTSLSGMEDFPLPEAHYLSNEGISSAPNEIVDDKVITHGANVPLLNDIQEDVPDMVRHHENDGNRIVSESSVSETTLFSAGIPAPSLVSAALQVSPGKVVVPAIIDQVQMQALVALQVLKVIEADVKPGDLCSRREYARWLVSGSSILSRSTVSKVYPAMYIENVTELAFDDVTPEDPDFPSIQGLAEAGLISSRLSIGGDISNTSAGHHGPFLFSPESPLSRQDLVCWKMALEKRELPEVDRKSLYLQSGFLDIDKINPDARPALMVDLSAGEHGIITLAFGYTRLFQPDKPVTKAQAAIALATGEAADIVGEELARIEAESMAEAAVAAHNALVAEVERDINVEFEKELETEREKITIMEKMAEEARLELERLRAEREEEKAALAEGRVTVESEKEILTRLRHDVEEQLENLMSKKTEILFERERIDKLRKEAESESQVITQLHYDLEVEKKALAMARAWAEEEAKKARHQAKVLEEARSWWERQGLKVIVDDELREDATVGATWIHAGGQEVVNENVSEHLKTIERGQGMVHKLKAMAGEMKLKSSASIERLIQKIQSFISFLRKKSADTVTSVRETKNVIFSRANVLADELGKNTSHLSSVVKDGVRKAAVDCRGGLGKFTEKFKT